MRNKHGQAQLGEQDAAAHQDLDGSLGRIPNAHNHPGSSRPSCHQRLSNNPKFQRALRVLQLLSALVSLGLFTTRLRRILQYTRRASASNGAVEGILVAAVLYTLVSTILRFVMRRNRTAPGAPRGAAFNQNLLRWLWLLLDLLFLGAFVAVACLTSPSGNRSSGPCRRVAGVSVEPKGSDCNLPWGTFVLAIVSVLLHAITALFHQVKSSYQQRRHGREATEMQGPVPHNGNFSNDQGPEPKQEPGYGQGVGHKDAGAM